MPLHPSSYCLAADCCACPQLPCFLHTSCPSRLSCCPHPSRLHRPVSDYLGILPCQHSLGCHPINPLSRLYPGEISSCLIINGNRQVQHHPCPSRNNFPLLSGLVWMSEAPPQSTKIENQAKYQKIAPNARTVTRVAILNLPPIFNALGASRCTFCASLNIPVSLIMLAPILFSI